MLAPHPGTRQKWIGVAAALAMMCTAGGVMFWTYHQPGPAKVPSRIYFYDMATGRVFAAKRPAAGGEELAGASTASAPGAPGAPGAEKAVVARVFSCGDCNREADRYVGFLERPDPEAAAQPVAGPGLAARAGRGGGPLVADPDAKDQWFGEKAPEGRKIVAAAWSKCGEGKLAHPCLPADD